MGFIKVVNTGIQVLLTLVAGWFCAHYKFLDGPEFSRKLNEFILKVLAPAFSIWLIGIKTDMRDVEAWRLIWVYIVWNTTLQVLVGLYVLIACRKRRARAFGLHSIVVSYNNTGIIGMVMGEAVLGPDMASLGLIISIPMFLQQVVATMFCFEWDKHQQAQLPLPLTQHTEDKTTGLGQHHWAAGSTAPSSGRKQEVLLAADIGCHHHRQDGAAVHCNKRKEQGVEEGVLRRSCEDSELGTELAVELAPASISRVYAEKNHFQAVAGLEQARGVEHHLNKLAVGHSVQEYKSAQLQESLTSQQVAEPSGDGHEESVSESANQLISSAVVVNSAATTSSTISGDSCRSSSSMHAPFEVPEPTIRASLMSASVRTDAAGVLTNRSVKDIDLLDRNSDVHSIDDRCVMVVEDGGALHNGPGAARSPFFPAGGAEKASQRSQNCTGDAAAAAAMRGECHDQQEDGPGMRGVSASEGGDVGSAFANEGVMRTRSIQGFWSPSFNRIKSFKPHRGPAASRLAAPSSPRQPPSPRALFIAQAAHIGFVVFTNPLLLFTIISVIMSLAGAPSILDPNHKGYIPGLGWIELTLGWLARTISPLSVFAQGLWLHGKIKQVATAPVKVCTYMVVKLVIAPALMLLLTVYCGLADRYSVGLIIMTTLPVGQIAWVLSEQYRIGTEAVTAVMLLGMATMLPHVLIMLKIIDHFQLFEYK